MRRAVVLAGASLGALFVASLCAGRCEARVLRDDAAQMTIDVSAPDAKTCVVFPASMRDEGCDGIDVSKYRVPASRTKVVTLVFSDHLVTVQIAVSDNPHDRAWTNEEATTFFDAALANARTDDAGAQWVDALTRVAVGDLQTHRRTLRFPSRALRQEIDLVEARDAIIAVQTTFAEARENEGISIAQGALRSLSVPAAPPLRREIATTALRLLAGVPLVALLALFAARSNKEKEHAS